MGLAMGKTMGNSTRNEQSSLDLDNLLANAEIGALYLDGELRMAQDVEMRVARERIHFFYPKNLLWSTESKAIAF